MLELSPMDPREIEAKIVAALPDAKVTLKDLTGTRDHWDGVVVSAAFAGKTLVQRQRMVFAALKEEMKGPIHAFTFKALTPEQANEH